MQTGCSKHITQGFFFSQNIFSYFFMELHIVSTLEAPHLGTSDEYPQNMFSWRKFFITLVRLRE